ncbi:hypothetical protein [Pacificibacter marinus]|uniref:Uncharacterized protein n=1 Tax=Pacificibacter marinus TaxID=658057 RepID=A0A1Y5RXT4_9RHOB|nr:hypothetical protein [Pacificibacter marinus]SEK35584.1 hypothetical protein SAMN04488032_10232 [Pacificibacter marinus]SLN27457.1 hypothetical protein PAM7971_01056 [Pacificibacter marinus]
MSDDFSKRFDRVCNVVEDLASALEESPFALSALHIERADGPDYSLINRAMFELLQAKAAVWDEAQRNPDQEADAIKAELTRQMANRQTTRRVVGPHR